MDGNRAVVFEQNDVRLFPNLQCANLVLHVQRAGAVDRRHLEQDPEIMKHYGCNISHQPVSNASFGFWPNMIPFIKAGVNVSLGTDGQTQSMFENMRAAQMIHRIRYEELELLPDKQMFEMATINGARSLQRCCRISPHRTKFDTILRLSAICRRQCTRR